MRGNIDDVVESFAKVGKNSRKSQLGVSLFVSETVANEESQMSQNENVAEENPERKDIEQSKREARKSILSNTMSSKNDIIRMQSRCNWRSEMNAFSRVTHEHLVVIGTLGRGAYSHVELVAGR